MVLFDVAERVDVSVTDHGSCDAKSGRRNDAGVYGTDEIFVVGAERGGDPLLLGTVDKIILAGKTG